MTDLISLGAAELAERIRTKQISPVTIVEAHIRRIKEVNPTINAVVTPTFEEAREQARAADARVQEAGTDSLPPLFGVPVTVKDALAVEGVRFTAGHAPLADNVAKQDAEAVRLFKEAGAIILGKTNCPDFSASTETENSIFGLTRNPWDTTRTVGGSSGGEGAIIAAGGSPLGLGSDIAGSVRLPAAFTGICSLKPSAGRIPTAGHVPEAPPEIESYGTVGPMARRVADLALALEVLSTRPVWDYRDVEWEGRRVFIPNGLPIAPPSRAIRRAMVLAANALGDAGAALNFRAELPLLDAVLHYSAVINRTWLADIGPDLTDDRAVKAVLGWSNAAGSILEQAGYGDMGKIDALRAQVEHAIGLGGVILWPVFYRTAPPHGFTSTPTGLPNYTVVANMLGLAAAVVPLGLASDGLPIAVQIMAQQDELALSAAAILEATYGGWRLSGGSPTAPR